MTLGEVAFARSGEAVLAASPNTGGVPVPHGGAKIVRTPPDWISRGVYGLVGAALDERAPTVHAPPTEPDTSVVDVHARGQRTEHPGEASAVDDASGSAGGEVARPAPAPSAVDDDAFPDRVKDAYASALIAAMRTFADTLEDELALL